MGIAAMVASMKFNDRRGKRETFKSIEYKSKREGIKSEPISEEALEAIRIKIEQQKNEENIRLYIVLFIAIVFSISLFYGLAQISGEDLRYFAAIFRG